MGKGFCSRRIHQQQLSNFSFLGIELLIRLSFQTMNLSFKIFFAFEDNISSHQFAVHYISSLRVKNPNLCHR